MRVAMEWDSVNLHRTMARMAGCGKENAEMLITAAAAVSAQLVVRAGRAQALRGNETIKRTMKAWEVPKEGSLF